nr:MAG TPA: hypothetical protein [Caudoviricetes sp.]
MRRYKRRKNVKKHNRIKNRIYTNATRIFSKELHESGRCQESRVHNRVVARKLALSQNMVDCAVPLCLLL